MGGFGQILDDLNRVGVRYVLIGGIALIRHGVVRATRDVDAILAPDPENLERLRILIEEWPATRPDGTPVPDEALAPGRTIHLATPHGEVGPRCAQHGRMGEVDTQVLGGECCLIPGGNAVFWGSFDLQVGFACRDREARWR